MRNTSISEYPKPFEKLITVEVKYAKRRSFIKGFLCGIIFVVILNFLGAFYVWLNRDKMMDKALTLTAPKLMESIFKAFPDAYVSYNKEKVLNTFDNFTNSVAANRISQAEFRAVGRKVVLALKDRRFTYKEIDGILGTMNSAAKNSN